MNWHLWWSNLAGYGYAVLVGHLFILPLMKTLWTTIGDAKRKDAHKEHPMMLGILERFLYVGAMQFGKPEFIAIWLALKVAGQWKAWGDARIVGTRTIAGRTIFNVFLIGNAFSISYGVVGGLLIDWLSDRQFQRGVIVSLSLVALTLAYWIWALKMRPSSN